MGSYRHKLAVQAIREAEDEQRALSDPTVTYTGSDRLAAPELAESTAGIAQAHALLAVEAAVLSMARGLDRMAAAMEEAVPALRKLSEPAEDRLAKLANAASRAERFH